MTNEAKMLINSFNTQSIFSANTNLNNIQPNNKLEELFLEDVFDSIRKLDSKSFEMIVNSNKNDCYFFYKE
ncbi:hypothetical protein [Thomasclavelia cocleata]|mgnify:CR=1 FL=1|jgi:hypothetical protein|uniref:hypothetical protein n=1 Tax=Thomasclavelia cocleata TaxID=69824 RepID=UPI00242DA0E9|nr:hypothetical protein [Thomasclavelia cocleata]